MDLRFLSIPGKGRKTYRVVWDGKYEVGRLVPYEYGRGWKLCVLSKHQNDLSGLVYLGLSSNGEVARKHFQDVFMLVRLANTSTDDVQFFKRMVKEGYWAKWPASRVAQFYSLANRRMKAMYAKQGAAT
jgi:hypothetical protein